jgi:hypothetical protein
MDGNRRVEGSLVPGLLVPGLLVLGLLVPGLLVPGLLVLGLLVPGSLVPGLLVPGLLVPGSLAPASPKGTHRDRDRSAGPALEVSGSMTPKLRRAGPARPGARLAYSSPSVGRRRAAADGLQEGRADRQRPARRDPVVLHLPDIVGNEFAEVAVRVDTETKSRRPRIQDRPDSPPSSPSRWRRWSGCPKAAWSSCRVRPPIAGDSSDGAGPISADSKERGGREYG